MERLREKVNDLQVQQARTEEKVVTLTEAVNALRAEMKPLLLNAAKGKAWLAAIALISAVLGASVRDAIVSLFHK